MLKLDFIFFPDSMFAVVFSVIFFCQQKKKKKKNWGKRCRILFFLLIAFQILHVFLPDISVHCALIKYAYI
jgi:hypothetical protein